VIGVIRAYSDTNETATAQTVEASITGALLGGGDGYQAFRYKTLEPHADWWAKLKASALPGANRPVPVLASSKAGGQVTLDGNGSFDADESSASLRVRFDLDGDGRFDTALTTNKRHTFTPPAPGRWRVGMEVQDSGGLASVTTCVVDFVSTNVLVINQPTISARTGGSATVIWNAGSGQAGKLYLLAATLSGTTPGTVLAPGRVLPLNVDAMTLLLLQSLNTPLFLSSIGSLNVAGGGFTWFSPPAGALVGLQNQTMHFAGVVFEANGGIALVTNAVGLGIID
jgi:hypothetical protein